MIRIDDTQETHSGNQFSRKSLFATNILLVLIDPVNTFIQIIVIAVTYFQYHIL